ncbi:Tape measure protein (TMP), partial [Durusdinium trenchii]
MSREIRAGRAFVELFADKAGLERDLRTAERTVKAFGQSVSRIGQTMVTVGALAAAAIVPAVSVYAGFGKEMSAVAAVTGATGEQFDALTAKARELGASTSFAASEAAQGMKFLGMAGFNTEQILAGIPAVLNLAKAGAVELGVAADIASDVSSAFGLAAEEITRVADVMAKAASSANVSIEGLGESFKFAAPAGAAAGQSIEEVTAALATMGNQGLKGSIAGRNLAIIFKQLSQSNVQRKLEELGVAVTDADGNFRDLHDIIHDLAGPLQELSEVERVRFLTDAFGEASKAAQILLTDAEGFVGMKQKLDAAAGSSEKMSQIMSDNLTGDFEALMSAVQDVAISLGTALDGQLRNHIQSITEATRALSTWITENKTWVTWIVTTIGVVTTLGAVLVSLGAAIKLVASGIAALRAIALTSLATLSALGVALAAITAIGLAVWFSQSTGAVREFNQALKESQRLTAELHKLQDKRVAQLFENAASIEAPEERKRFLAEELKRAELELAGMQASLRGAKENVQALDTTWNRLTGNKLLAGAEAEVAEIEDSLTRQKDLVSRIRDEIQANEQAADQAAEQDATSAAAEAVNEVSDALKQFAEGVRRELQTPQEAFTAYMAQLEEALQNELITQAEFDQAARAAEEQLAETERAEDKQRQETLARPIEERLDRERQTAQAAGDLIGELQALRRASRDALQSGLGEKASEFKQQELETLLRAGTQIDDAIARAKQDADQVTGSAREAAIGLGTRTLDGDMLKEQRGIHAGINQETRVGTIVSGPTDRAGVFAELAANLPLTYGPFVLKSVARATLVEGQVDVWNCEIVYGAFREKKPLQEGESEFRFASARRTIRRTVSINSRAFDASGLVSPPPEDVRIIGWKELDKRAEGIEETEYLNAFSWRVAVPFSTASEIWRRNVGNLRGSLNQSPFFGYEAGEVLFDDITGSVRGAEMYIFELSFQQSENIASLDVGGINVTDVGGWDVIDVDDQEIVEDTDRQMLIPKVRQVKVHEVKQKKDWTLLSQLELQADAHAQALQTQERAFRRETDCHVKNASGDDRRTFEVLQIRETIFAAEDNEAAYQHQFAFVGEEVDQDDTPRVVILQTPAAEDAIRPARYAGVSQVRLTGPVGKPAAGPRSGAYALEAADAGPFTILHDPGPSDEERCAIVRFGRAVTGYLARVPCGEFIPAARDRGKTPGTKSCCLFRIEEDPDEPEAPPQIEPLTDSEDELVRARVHNPWGVDVGDGCYLPIIQDSSGRWVVTAPDCPVTATDPEETPEGYCVYEAQDVDGTPQWVPITEACSSGHECVEPIDVPTAAEVDHGATLYTSCVPTTDDPLDGPPGGIPGACSGRPQWTWSASLGQWELVADDCEDGAPTTTSGPSTTVGPSTTAAPTTTGPSTTGGTTTTAGPTTTLAPTTTAAPTTTEPGCPCPPTTTEESTTTGGTTTGGTTTSGTTTGGPTTTSPPSTTGGPTTTGSPTTTAGPTTTGAPTTTEGACRPVYPTFCGTVDGECTFTYCSRLAAPEPPEACPPSTTAGPSTTCDCEDPSIDAELGPCDCWADWECTVVGWRQIDSGGNCSGAHCREPERPAESCAGGDTPLCGTVIRTSGNRSASSSGPCSGECYWGCLDGQWILLKHECAGGAFGCYCEPPSRPCGNCGVNITRCAPPRPDCAQSCVPTTTEGPTPTEPELCSGDCLARWDGFEWQVVSDGCDAPCSCVLPVDSPSCDELRLVGCIDFPPTTTEPPTTTQGCDGSITWYCSGGGGQWMQIDGECTGSCGSTIVNPRGENELDCTAVQCHCAAPPPSACDQEETIVVSCGCYEAPTTTAPLTTSDPCLTEECIVLCENGVPDVQQGSTACCCDVQQLCDCPTTTPGPTTTEPQSTRAPMPPTADGTAPTTNSQVATDQVTLTVVVPTRDDYYGCWNTVNSLLDHHGDVVDEIIVVDNGPKGSEHSQLLQSQFGNLSRVRYDRIIGPESSCRYKDRGIRQASSEFVLCCDSHVLFPAGVLARLKEYCARHRQTSDLLMGPICHRAGQVMATQQALYAWENLTPQGAEVLHGVVCRGGNLGAWATDPRGLDPEGEPFEIQQNGTGAFACRTAAWPGWPPTFNGHGGNETFLMESFRQAGGRVLCLPFFRWTHNFGRTSQWTDKQGRPTKVPYDMQWAPKAANYLSGFVMLDRPQLWDAISAHLENYCPQVIRQTKRKFPRPRGLWESLEPAWRAAGGDRGGAIPRPLFHELRKRIRPGMYTLEFGSGLSTLLFEAVGTDHIAIEHDSSWAERLRPLLKRERTRLVVSPIDGEAVEPWYQWRPAAEGPDAGRQVDLVLIDGPPGRIGRAGCRHLLADLLAPAATVLIDDTHREAEQKLSEDLQGMYGFRSRRVQCGQRAFDILVRTVDQSAYEEGAGTKLGRLLKERYGMEPLVSCGCKGKMREMNYRGVEWCEKNIDTIVDWLQEGAKHWSARQQGAQGLVTRTWLAIVPDFAQRKFIAGLVSEAIAGAAEDVQE